MRKLRIAQVTNLQESIPPVYQHGLEQLVYDLTEELVKMGHQVTVFGTADSRTSAKVYPLWPTATLRDSKSRYVSPENFVSWTFTNWAIAEVFAHHQEFDIIHDHSRFLAPLFARLISTPIVSTVHHRVDHVLEEGYKNVLQPDQVAFIEANWGRKREAVDTVVVSDFQASKYSGNCTVIHNGMEIEPWKFIQNPGKYLAFLGYITKDKGVAEAIQAVLPTNKSLLIAGPLDDSEVNQKYFRQEIEPFLDGKNQVFRALGF